MRISALQVGQTLCLEVRPEMTGAELKCQIKEIFRTWDEVTRSTTLVEVVVGDRLGNDEKVADAGLSADTVVSVVFKENLARCSSKDAIANFSTEIDLSLLLAVEIPSHEAKIAMSAFQDCKRLAKLTIPDSVTHIGHHSFQDCSSLVSLTIPNSVTDIGNNME